MKTISFRNIALSIFTLFITSVLLASCSKSNSNSTKPGTSHKVIYKATVTNGAIINGAAYSDAGGQTTNQSSLNTTTYTSPEITIPASQSDVIFVIVGSGTSTSSTITATITVDGVVKETSTGSGTAISVDVSHVF